MVAEFTVVRGGVKNWIDMPLGATDRAINIDAATNERTDMTPIHDIMVKNSEHAGASRVRVYSVRADLGEQNQQDLYNIVYNCQTSIGVGQSFNLFYLRQGTSWTGIADPTITLFNAQFTSYPANTAHVGILIAYVRLDDNGTLPPWGLWTLTSYFWDEKRRVANSINILRAIDLRYYIYANQAMTECVFYPTYFYLGNNVTITVSNVTIFDAYVRMANGAAQITGNLQPFRYTTQSTILGTITGNLEVFYSSLVISNTTAINGYAAVLSADINANNKAFTVYGSRIDIDGIIGGGATWRGHYLNAVGVTCGAGQFFYGIDMDFTGMGVGGTIVGINLNTPTNVPAMRFPLATGNTVIVTGDVAGVARSMIFNMPVVAGGAAAGALSWLFQLDSVTEAGLIAETDGAGSYRLPLFKIPNYSADYGVAWVAPPAPAPAGLVNGCGFVAHNTNGNLYRLYFYTNAGWHYATLT